MELLVSFQNADVELRVYELENKEKRYWIRAGVALLEFTEETLGHLFELLESFIEEGGAYYD